jgi:O-antigen/teichoic acid export membrane protein
MTLARKVMQNASMFAVGRVLGTAMGIVSVGVTTRYLGLEGYGALAVALAFLGIVTVVSEVGIWSIGTREIARRPAESQRVVSALLTIGIGLCVVAMLAAAATVIAIYGGEDHELTRRAAFLLILSIPFLAPAGALNAYFLGRQQVYQGTVASLVGGVVILGGVTAAAALDLGFTGAVIPYALNGPVQALIVGVFPRGGVRLRPSSDLALCKQILGWALPLGGATVIHTLYWRLDLILLSLLASKTEVGLYGFTYRIVDALTVLPGLVTVTLMPEFARLAQHRDRFTEILEKALAVMQVGAAAVLVIFVAFAGEIVELVGGSSFSRADGVLQLLTVGVALTYLGAIFSQAFIAMNRQGKLLLLTLVMLSANLALNLLLIPLWGAEGAAVAFGLTEAVHLTMILVLYRGFASLPRPRSVLRVLAAATLAMGAAELVRLSPLADVGGTIAVLAAGGAAAMATFVGSLYALRAMPSEIHDHVILPVWTRLRPKRSASLK